MSGSPEASPRILVIEDDAPLAAMLERGLRLAGYEVDAVEDGLAGAERWQGDRYVAVILDVMIPGRGGIELCRAMRETGDRTPVVLLTARDDPEKRAAGLAAGANAYVTKPFIYGDLIALIRDLGRQHHGSDSPLPGRSR